MPNWCSNKLEVDGSKKDIALFAATFENGLLCFSQTVQLPEELSGLSTGSMPHKDKVLHVWRDTPSGPEPVDEDALVAKYGTASWHDWCVKHWGTKWDLSDCTPAITGTKIRAWFDTAWSPPEGWLKSVSAKFQNLDFTLYFSEGGMGFWGTVKAKAGTCISDVNSKGYYREGLTDEDWNDPTECCSPAVRTFLRTHGLHIGG